MSTIPPCPVHKRPLVNHARTCQCGNPRFTYRLHGWRCPTLGCKVQHVTPKQHRRNVGVIDKVARLARPLINLRSGERDG